MRALILSDIHGNLEALTAVLAATTGEYDELWNLGDVVGYGGSPNQVLDLVRLKSTLNVRGNHDRVCCGLTSANGFNPVARTAALWTQKELTPDNLGLAALRRAGTAASRPSRRDLRTRFAAPRGPLHPEHARRLGSAPADDDGADLLRPHPYTGRLRAEIA